MIPVASVITQTDVPRVGDEFFTIRRGSGGVVGVIVAVTLGAGVKPIAVQGRSLVTQTRGEWYYNLDELQRHPGGVWEAL